VPALLLAAAAVFSFCFQLLSMADDSTLDRPVRSFYSSNENVYDAMLRFGRENNVPIWLVFRYRLCSTQIGQLSIEHTSARSVIQEFTREAPSYSFSWKTRLLFFFPMISPAATPSFLELRVPNYSIPEDTLQTQVVFAWMNIRSSLRPNEGTAFDILSSPQSVKWPSQALNNLNVELDHLITRKRGVGDHANDDNLLQKGRPLIMR